LAKFTSATALSAHQQRRFARVKRSLTIEHGFGLADTVGREADRLLSGTMSKRELARRRPYSRRNPDYSVPRLPIHQHTGRLKRSKRLIPITNGWRLQYTAPYAKFVLRPGGTRPMRARGFYTELRRQYPRIHQRMLRAKRSAEAG
jgi:hypothetical protein